MYKCGWNGCEKAYGTLNHLNAHVTMQSHGQKRTPEGNYISHQPPIIVATSPQSWFRHYSWLANRILRNQTNHSVDACSFCSIRCRDPASAYRLALRILAGGRTTTLGARLRTDKGQPDCWVEPLA